MNNPSGLRIGIVGVENSHADHYVRYLNVEHRHGHSRIVGIAGSSERTRELAAKGGIDIIVPSSEELVDTVDAAIVCNRDGRLHKAAAAPFVKAGKPVFIDKPIACEIGDAEELIALAKANRVPLTSFSALRWLPEVRDLRDHNPKDIFVSGPADPESEYGGLFFYGIHLAELALEIAGSSEIGFVRGVTAGDGVVLALTVGDDTVTINLVRPRRRERTYWGIVVAESSGIRTAEISLGRDYLAPGLDVLMNMFESGMPPLSDAELLAPVQLLSAAENVLR